MTAVHSDAIPEGADATQTPDGAEATAPESPVRVLDRRLRVTTPQTWMVFVGAVVLLAAGLVWAAFGRAPTEVRGQSMVLPEHGLYEVPAGVEGVVEEMTVTREDLHLDMGQSILRVRRPDGQLAEVKAPVAGELITQLVKPGSYVKPDTHIATLVPEHETLVGVVYVPAAQGKRVREGMRVFFSPSTAPAAQYGSMTGTVGGVSQVPASAERIRLNLGDNNDLVNFLTEGGPVIEIVYSLDKDPSTPSGYAWTSGSGPPFSITSGTLGTASIVLSEKSPLSQLFG